VILDDTYVCGKNEYFFILFEIYSGSEMYDLLHGGKIVGFFRDEFLARSGGARKH